jgi:hypothetical protein
MSDDLKQETEALERAFFAPGVPLDESLRRRSATEQRRDALRDVVGIKDEAFLNRLLAMEIRPETVVALRIIPLVFVAWADGAPNDRERAAVLKAATERGVTAKQMAGRMLKVWLAQEPSPALLPMWKKYMSRIWNRFTFEEQSQMRQTLLLSTREIAEAAGSFLGLTSGISPKERSILSEFEELLQ